MSKILICDTIKKNFKTYIRCRGSRMFKNISINLKNPICQCKKQDLYWNVFMDKGNRPYLLLGCNTCKTQLQINPNEFKAHFNFETEYPDGIKEKDEIDLNPEISKEDVAFLKKNNIFIK